MDDPRYRLEQISFSSPAYQEMIALREKILRTPLGLHFTPNELAHENQDIHLGVFHTVSHQLIACCVLTQINAETIKLRQMAVDQAFQRQHIGSALLRFAEDIAREKGYRLIILHARLHAVAFYQKHGYQAMGEPFLEVTIPHMYMQKKLS